jgi:hypothetical protein
MSEPTIQHLCEENWYKDAEIVYTQINIEKSSWVLEQTYFASAHEVKEGLAEEVGDTISYHVLLISFCPFCGEKLIDEGANKQ